MAVAGNRAAISVCGNSGFAGIPTHMPRSATAKKKTKALVPFDPASPLSDPRYEKYARLRSVLRPRGDAYRQAGFQSESDHAAQGNAAKLEREVPAVEQRIAYLCRQDEQVLAAKRQRIEELLWSMHEFNYAELWKVIEVEKRDKKGDVVKDSDGNPVKVVRQVPKLFTELSEDMQRMIESCNIDEHGRVVPKAYSKMQANQELRKLLGIGVAAREDGDVSRMSDAELIAELARQAKDLGIEIDLNYRFAS